MNHSNLSVQPSSASNITGPRRLENVIDWPKVNAYVISTPGEWSVSRELTETPCGGHGEMCYATVWYHIVIAIHYLSDANLRAYRAQYQAASYGR